VTHGERDEVEFGVGDVSEERVGGELDAPRRRDGRGPRLDGCDGDVGPGAPEHVDGDDRLHRLSPVRDGDQHLRAIRPFPPPPVRTRCGAKEVRREERVELAFLGAGGDAMAWGDEDASARVRVWRRRTRAGGEWWEPEEGARGVLERVSAEARGRVAISFGVPCLLRYSSLSRWCSRTADTVGVSAILVEAGGCHV
jgi:hypothetical protein